MQHGNEDTFKEMLRIKRSVQVQYNTDVSYITAQMIAGQEKAKAAGSGDAMQQLDRMTIGGPGEMTFVKYVHNSGSRLLYVNTRKNRLINYCTSLHIIT